MKELELLEEKLKREGPEVRKLYNRKIRYPRIALIGSVLLAGALSAYIAIDQFKKFGSRLAAMSEENSRFARREQRLSRELHEAVDRNSKLREIASNSVRYIDLLIEPFPEDGKVDMTEISQRLAAKGYDRLLHPPEMFRILIDYHENRLPESLRRMASELNNEWLGLELRREGDKLSCLFGPYTKLDDSFPFVYSGREFDVTGLPRSDFVEAERLQPELVKFLFSREYRDLPKEIKPIKIWLPPSGVSAQVGYSIQNGITISPSENGYKLRGVVELPVPTETLKYVNGNIIVKFGDDEFKMKSEKDSEIYNKIDADEKQAGRKFTPGERKQYFIKEFGAK